MDITTKYDLVPYGQGDQIIQPHPQKSNFAHRGLDLTPMNRQGSLQRPTLYTPSDKPGIIQKTYNFRRGIQHTIINPIGSQVNIYV
jgi:hypothetical protein